MLFKNYRIVVTYRYAIYIFLSIHKLYMQTITNTNLIVIQIFPNHFNLIYKHQEYYGYKRETLFSIITIIQLTMLMRFAFSQSIL